MSIRLRGVAKSSLPAAVASGAPVDAYLDLNGRLVVVLGSLIAGEDQTNDVLKTSGGVAVGAAASGKPVLVGISDGTNVRYLKGNADGTLAVGGFTSVPAATLTRPANTTAYAAGDEMTDTGGAILQFTAARVNGGTGIITGVQITNSVSAATKATGELRLYDTTSTPATDNLAFDASDGVNDTLVAVIPFSTASEGLTGTGGNCVYDVNGLTIPFACGGSDTKLYGRIILKSAYTSPANSDTWKIKLRLLQD